MSTDHSSIHGQLAAAYGRGVLTPFVGAGLSRPACPGWPDFVAHLEASAGIGDGPARRGSSDLVRRASRATRILRNRGGNALGAAIKKSIYERAAGKDGVAAYPASTCALAEIWWPLILTTNYDSLLLDCWNANWVRSSEPLPDLVRMLPVGRSRADCQRVLNASRAPDNPLLWALQGHLPRLGKLAPSDELIVGHEEYRRQTHQAAHFRRAFAEIYRSRTLLFLGAGLQEPYLLDLFGEALELLGTIPHVHYALMRRGETDPEFLLRRFQIRVIEYGVSPAADAGAQTEAFLHALRAAIDGPRPRTTQWSARIGAKAWIDPGDEIPDISVIRGVLPTDIDFTTTATLISAGRGDKGLRASKEGPRIFAAAKVTKEELAKVRRKPPGRQRVYRIGRRAVYLGVARDPLATKEERTADRDARLLAPVTREFLKRAERDGFKAVNVMLLAAGIHRTFPQHISLQGMINGYRQWQAKRPPGPVFPMRIFIWEPPVLRLLEARRIDLLRMAALEELTFWIETDADRVDSAPTLALARPDTPLARVLREHAIPCEGWSFEVRPAPRKGASARPVEELFAPGRPVTVGSAGLFAGSTLILRRLPRPSRRRGKERS